MLKGYVKDIRPEYGAVVQYTLLLGEERLPLNELIGASVRLEHNGDKRCTFCNRAVKKLFPNGSCYPCFIGRAENDLCVVKPHTCHYDTCRDQKWGDANCMIPTYLYIAKSSDVKVGISKAIPKRWMDQGAVEAVPIALLPTRVMAGELEAFLSQHMPDKTDWRKMLKAEVVDTPLLDVRQRVLDLVPEQYRAYLLADQEPTAINYPVQGLPEKLASHDLDKAPAAGTLLGIKAKYLILSTGVLNIPKFAGYYVALSTGAEAEAAATRA